jgi:hypothetical protein
MINIIALEKGRYYVGKHSIRDIQNGLGPTWVKTYKPVKLIKQIQDTLEYDTLLEYMETYGIDYVRGFTYTSMELSSYDRDKLNKLLHGPKEKAQEIICNYCNKIGHNEYSCDDLSYDRTNKFEQISYKSSHKEKNTTVSYNNTTSKSYQCMYCEIEFDNSDILNRHIPICKDEAFIRPSGKGLNCERCGRNTHATANCRAKTDIYGYDL